MTDEAKIHKTQPDVFKQIYYADEKFEKYTTAFVNETDYMKTYVWQNIRREVFKRDGYKCVMCGASHPLNVHHVRYPTRWGEEKLEDLITVCDSCHAKIHSKEIKR